MNASIVPSQSSDNPDILSSSNFDGTTLWATQAQIARQFQTDRSNVTKHLQNAYAEGELDERATCKEIAQVQIEGERSVTRKVLVYNLDAIIAVGYRVNSVAGTRFRIKANEILKTYMTKGVVVSPALSPAEAILQIATAMVETERKLAAHDSHLDEHDNRLDMIEAHIQTEVEYFTVTAYFRNRGLPSPSLNNAQSIGQRATTLSHAKGYDIGKTSDPRWGLVNTYHRSILDEIVGRLS